MVIIFGYRLQPSYSHATACSALRPVSKSGAVTGFTFVARIP